MTYSSVFSSFRLRTADVISVDKESIYVIPIYIINLLNSEVLFIIRQPDGYFPINAER